jgi:hypothetical protein
MPDFETRLKDVSHAAWLIWTANGLGLDDLGLEQTSKSATDAANDAPASCCAASLLCRGTHMHDHCP